MSAPSTHDFKFWVVIFGNLPIVDLNGIKIEFPEKWKKSVGGQGKVTRSKSNDQTCRVTLTLPETSLGNTVLDQLFEADDNTPGGVTHPLLIKDALGTTQVNVLNAWSVKKPDLDVSADDGEREWIIDCGDTQSVVAGK